MVGLVLQGGGTRGSYQIGAYLALKQKHIKIDGICGTSIGAVNGAMIAAGKEKELLEFWQNISVGEILGFNKDFIEKLTKKEHDLKYFLLGAKNIFHILKTRGIPIAGLENVLKENITEQDLMKSKIDFGLCTVRVHDLKPLYIFKKDMHPNKLHDYILASCYLPLFKMEKKIDSHYYIDGGFYDNIPVNMLIDKGYKKIYVVELNPLLNRCQKPKKEIEMIRITPKRSLGSVLVCDKDKLKENIKMGYYDTIRILKKLDGYHYCFKNYPEFLFNWLTRKIPKKNIKRVMNFFNAKTKKQAVIKSLEYLMQKENIDYYKIYNPLKMIKKIKKANLKNHFVLSFVKSLRFL